MQGVIHLTKKFLKTTVFRAGTVQSVMVGSLRGARIPMSVDMGWEVLAGRWEPYLQKLYPRMILPGSVCYDVGANTGIHTLLFSRLVGHGGKVIAFEPYRINSSHLRHLVRLNNASNVEIVEVALGCQNEDVDFFLGIHNKQGSMVGIGCQSGETIKVSCRTVDSLITEGLPPPNFLKLDIEGAESSALEGAKRTLETLRPTMVVELHTPEEDIKVGRILTALDYVAYRIFRNSDDKRRHNSPSLRIQRLDSGWPTSDGLWGTIFTVPRESASLFAERGFK